MSTRLSESFASRPTAFAKRAFRCSAPAIVELSVKNSYWRLTRNIKSRLKIFLVFSIIQLILITRRQRLKSYDVTALYKSVIIIAVVIVWQINDDADDDDDDDDDNL